MNMPEPINPIGQCFESAAHQLAFGGYEQNPDGTKLVHAIAKATYPGQEGLLIGHAWLEFEHEGEKVAIDTTYGTYHKASDYRETIEVSYAVEYTLEEVRKNWHLHNNPGPWDIAIRTVTDAAKKRGDYA